MKGQDCSIIFVNNHRQVLPFLRDNDSSIPYLLCKGHLTGVRVRDNYPTVNENACKSNAMLVRAAGCFVRLQRRTV